MHSAVALGAELHAINYTAPFLQSVTVYIYNSVPRIKQNVKQDPSVIRSAPALRNTEYLLRRTRHVKFSKPADPKFVSGRKSYSKPLRIGVEKICLSAPTD